MRVFAYARVSTKHQAEEGESLGVQQRMLEGYALMKGWNIEEMIVEKGVSGSKPLASRPAAAAMLEKLGPGDVVVATKLDRAFRDTEDALATRRLFVEKGWDLHLLDLGGSVIKGDVAELVFTILAGIGQFERRRIIARVREVKEDQATRGRFLGGRTPLLSEIQDGAVVERADADAILGEMRTMREAGETYRAIAEAMRTRRGIDIAHTSVMRALKRAA